MLSYQRHIFVTTYLNIFRHHSRTKDVVDSLLYVAKKRYTGGLLTSQNGDFDFSKIIKRFNIYLVT